MAYMQENSSPRSIHSIDSSTSRVPETPETQPALYNTNIEISIDHSTETATVNAQIMSQTEEIQDSQYSDITSAPNDFEIILNAINDLSSQVTDMQKILSAKVNALDSKVDNLHKTMVGKVVGLLDIQGQLVQNLSTSAGVQEVLIREIAGLKGKHVKMVGAEESKTQGEPKRRRTE